MLPARNGAALALIARVVFVAAIAAACGQPQAENAGPPVASDGVLSAEWIYAPSTAETERATGAIRVDAAVGARGPERTISAARGGRLEAVLVGPAAPDSALAAALAQPPPAMLYAVRSGNLCPSGQATHVVWSEPEMIEGRTLALGVISGAAPGETGSTVCRVLRYRRDRGDGSEGAR